MVEFTRVSEDVRLVRALVVEPRNQPVAREQAGDRLLGEWLDWLKRVQSLADPLERGAAALFSEIAEVTEWTFRD